MVASAFLTPLRVFLGNGDGTLSAPIASPIGGHGVWLGLADLNGDGVLDVAMSDSFIAEPRGRAPLLDHVLAASRQRNGIASTDASYRVPS